jgi:hypothetical protein
MLGMPQIRQIVGRGGLAVLRGWPEYTISLSTCEKSAEPAPLARWISVFSSDFMRVSMFDCVFHYHLVTPPAER